MKTKSFEVTIDGVTLQLRRLSRSELAVYQTIPTREAQVIYVVEVACLTDLDDYPFGWLYRAAHFILAESYQGDAAFDAELERINDPEWVAENIIATAFPTYDFQVQSEMDLESWNRLWARAYWKMVTLMGVDAKVMKKLLNPPPPGQMDRDEFQRNVQAMEMLAGFADDTPSQLRQELLERINGLSGSQGLDEVRNVRPGAVAADGSGNLPGRSRTGMDHSHPRRGGVSLPPGRGVPG